MKSNIFHPRERELITVSRWLALVPKHQARAGWMAWPSPEWMIARRTVQIDLLQGLAGSVPLKEGKDFTIPDALHTGCT